MLLEDYVKWVAIRMTISANDRSKTRFMVFLRSKSLIVIIDLKNVLAEGPDPPEIWSIVKDKLLIFIIIVCDGWNEEVSD